jgi:hypothetical protein
MVVLRVLALAGLTVVLACASNGNGVENGGGGGAGAGETPGGGGGEDVVTLPDAALRELKAFLARPQILLADRVEVDASRIPFQAEMVPMNDPAYVESVEMGAPAAKAIGLLMRTRAAAPMVERDFPRLQLGDGTILLATREIAVRTWVEVNEAEPAFLRVRGIGNAVYRDDASGRQIRKDVVALRATITRSGSGYVFRSVVE